MSTITKQWLQQTIAEMEEHRDLFPGDLDDNHGKVLAALHIALASLEAEAVAYADPQAFRNFQAGVARREWMWRNPGEDLIAVYTAPPAPVSVPDDLEMKPILKDGHQIVGYEYKGERYSTTAGCAWNTAIRTFRSAMLQGKAEVIDGN